MKELQQLKTWAEAERLKAGLEAEKKGKDDNMDQWWFFEGQHEAFNLVARKAELLLSKSPIDNVPPQLNKHDCYTTLELLQQMLNEKQNQYTENKGGGTRPLDYDIDTINHVIKLIKKRPANKFKYNYSE